MKFTIIATLACTVTAAAAKVSYAGTKVFRVDVNASEQDAAALQQVVDSLELPLWTERIAPGRQVDIQVAPEKLRSFNEAVVGRNVTIMHEDLQESIDAESAEMNAFDFSAAAIDMSWFNSYHTFADHLTWYSQLAAKFPNNAKVITAGTSYEGRNISGVHLYGASGPSTKPAVIFTGTVHAREWITTMVVEYMTYSLLNNYANSTEIKGYLDKYDFYMLPVVNPDGFSYTQTDERLWRKNRQPGTSCDGTDINRNWDYEWASGGSSTSQCAEDYRGPSAGSTPEYKVLSTFQNNLVATNAGVKMIIDWHSYSQLFMSPYGYTCSKTPADNAEFLTLGAGYAKALGAVYGTDFDYGPICTTIYQASGSGVDYSYDVSGIKYSFTSELRDTGTYGFVLPANQILPSGIETFAGVKSLLANIK